MKLPTISVILLLLGPLSYGAQDNLRTFCFNPGKPQDYERTISTLKSKDLYEQLAQKATHTQYDLDDLTRLCGTSGSQGQIYAAATLLCDLRIDKQSLNKQNAKELQAQLSCIGHKERKQLIDKISFHMTTIKDTIAQVDISTPITLSYDPIIQGTISITPCERIMLAINWVRTVTDNVSKAHSLQLEKKLASIRALEKSIQATIIKPALLGSAKSLVIGITNVGAAFILSVLPAHWTR